MQASDLVLQVLKPGLDPGAARVFLEFLSYSSGPLPEEQFAKVKVQRLNHQATAAGAVCSLFVGSEKLIQISLQGPCERYLSHILGAGAGGRAVGRGRSLGKGGMGPRLLLRKLPRHRGLHRASGRRPLPHGESCRCVMRMAILQATSWVPLLVSERQGGLPERAAQANMCSLSRVAPLW